MDSRRIAGVRLLSRFSLRGRVRGETTLERSVWKKKRNASGFGGRIARITRPGSTGTNVCAAREPPRRCGRTQGWNPASRLRRTSTGVGRGPGGREDATRNHGDGQAASRVCTQAWSCAADSTGSREFCPLPAAQRKKGARRERE